MDEYRWSNDLLVQVSLGAFVVLLLGAIACLAPVVRSSLAGHPKTVEQRRKRRLDLYSSVGSGLLTGILVTGAVFVLGVVQSRSDRAEREAQELEQRRQSLALALAVAPDLQGLDAATLDDRVESGADGAGRARTGDDLCTAESGPRPRRSEVLHGLRLTGKDLDHANFDGMHLQGVDLSHASLRHATFCHAVLEDVVLQGADLTSAVLHEARMQDVDLQFTKMEDAQVWGIEHDSTLVNAETCWTQRWIDGTWQTQEGLAPQALSHPDALVQERSPGHTCDDREAERWMAGEERWFAG